jgi:hypothetical protein
MAKKAEQRAYAASPGRLYQAAIRAVSELGYTLLHSDAAAGVVSFNTGRSMKSWGGQDLSATVVPDGPSQSLMLVGGSLAKGGMPMGGGAQVGAWGEKGGLTRRFYETVEAILPQTPEPASAGGGGDQESVATQIAKLAALRASGALTDSEFAAAKARLLG